MTSALQEDIQRLAAISVSLYKAGRYTPTDRVERAIETIGERVVRAHRSVRNPDDLSNVTGWRLGERALEHTTAHSATEALRELAIEAWRAGFGRRALFTIRRLLSIIVVAPKEDTKFLDELEEDLQLSVIRTARSTDGSLADRERSRQLVLSLAPEFMALGQAAQPQTDDVLWEQVFGTLDAIAWSPAGSEIEAATEIYLYFLSGTDPSASLEAGRPWDVVSWNRRPVCRPRELPPGLREHLLQALRSDATSDQPGIALLVVVALWRDVLVRDDRQALEAFRDALAEHVLDGGRRDFELPILWSHTDNTGETAPRFRGPGIHWRLFDVAEGAHRWACNKLDTGESAVPVLPPVTTPDADLRSLIRRFGAVQLIDERRYYGIESGEDCLVLVEEADRSRRLLRDCEGSARARFAWGYPGTGPYNLAAALVADMLGSFTYCSSCFGVIPAGGGLVKCPSCYGHGLRKELRSLHGACYYVTASLPKKPDQSLQESGNAPFGAQWRLSRIEFLQGAFQLADQLAADDVGDTDVGD